MGLDELADEKEQEQKNNKVEGLKEQLGVENEEELEQLDDRLGMSIRMLVNLDKRIEELEQRVDVLEKVVSEDGD